MILRMGIAVLAGGQGSRMGGDKPQRRLGNSTLLERAVRRAESWSLPTVLVFRSPGQAPSLGQGVIYDDPTIAGPLGGLASALAWAATEGLDAVLTMPCDMPFLPEDLAGRLNAALVEDVAVAVAASDGHRHPVCALWRPEVIEALRDRARQGRLSLTGLVDAVGGIDVGWADADPDPFRNINTQAELAWAEAVVLPG